MNLVLYIKCLTLLYLFLLLTFQESQVSTLKLKQFCDFPKEICEHMPIK